jgi:hypothetical protein
MNFILSILVLAVLNVCIRATPLDDYVWRVDENYGWVDMGPEHQFRGEVGKRGYTGYTLNVTSQKWLTDEDFSPDSESKSIWWHILLVLVPGIYLFVSF